MGAQLLEGNVIISVILAVFIIILFLNVAAIGRQPVQKIELSFKVGVDDIRLSVLQHRSDLSIDLKYEASTSF